MAVQSRASEQLAKGACRRSSSDSALLQHVQQTTNAMTTGVRELLGVDVSRTSRRELRKASFVAGLDIGGVSADPSDPTSATAQAAKMVLARSKRRSTRKKDDAAATLVGAGRM